MGTAALQEQSFGKQASKKTIFEDLLTTGLISTPISYYASGSAENKFRRGERLSNVEDFVRKHPFLTSIIGTVGATSLKRSIGKNLDNYKSKGEDPFFKDAGHVAFRLKPEHVNQLYSDLLE